MIDALFHAWERRLAAVSDHERVVRPFAWGADWIDVGTFSVPIDPGLGDRERLGAWADAAVRESDRFFAAPATREYRFEEHGWDGDGLLTFPSAIETPHPENNRVHARYVPARRSGRAGPARAVLVLPQWNSDEAGHVGLCRILARFGLSALRLSLPYHDRRMPPELTRADYIVSANVGRTLQACRQAVVDARRAIAWLVERGYERIGILGSSLGSCLALLTAAHEPHVRAQALNHISPYFADVVWEGLSTAHVRHGLDGHIDLDELRRLWLPISPQSYLSRVGSVPTLLVYASYDLTFPPRLSRQLVEEFRRRQFPHEVRILPCGHYSIGRAPFKYVDGYLLTRFLASKL